MMGVVACHLTPQKQRDTISSTDQKDTTQTVHSLSFRASGAEPFWAIKVTPNKSITYDSADDSSITFAYKVPKINNAEKVYIVNNKTHSLTLRILKKACQNGMSGQYFTHTVWVTLKNLETQNEEKLQGCGEYFQVEQTDDK